jgi:hypothetical protein
LARSQFGFERQFTIFEITSPYVEIIKSQKCSLPCWIGIQVDKTNFDAAKEMLKERYKDGEIESFEEKSLVWKAYGVDGVNEGYASFVDGVVKEILISFDSKADFTVGDLVKIVGEPAWVFVSDQPNNYCSAFDLNYPTAGFYVSLEMNGKQKNIESGTRIGIIRFLPIKLTNNIYVFDGSLVKWDGYKRYCKN